MVCGAKPSSPSPLSQPSQTLDRLWVARAAGVSSCESESIFVLPASDSDKIWPHQWSSPLADDMRAKNSHFRNLSSFFSAENALALLFNMDGGGGGGGRIFDVRTNGI